MRAFWRAFERGMGWPRGATDPGPSTHLAVVDYEGATVDSVNVPDDCFVIAYRDDKQRIVPLWPEPTVKVEHKATDLRLAKNDITGGRRTWVRNNLGGY